ncbi:MAG: hypothetical protein IPH58_02245 [Sphingobacteriales bacterium]|nr:hypothetical protein [Sphingobacteriales bacterium]
MRHPNIITGKNGLPINAATTPTFTQVASIATHGGAATICYPNGVRLELGSINIAVLKELLCCI